MKNQFLPKGALKRTSQVLCVFMTCSILSACKSTNSFSIPEQEDSRSELVFLNIEEASGWVAYNCNPGEATSVEDYRVVVIRQNSGEIIYDSQIPLASDLCTHGFEMSPDDPRLQKLKQNVDSGIIEPLEAYQRSLEEAEKSQPPKEEDEDDVVVVEGGKETSRDESSNETTPESETQPPNGNNDNPPSFPIAKFDDSNVEFKIPNENDLQVGDRLFLREKPTTMQIPGTDNEIMDSEGLVTGLVQVIKIEGSQCTAKILSGTVPEDGIAEKIINL